jgi:hypothetical protein
MRSAVLLVGLLAVMLSAMVPVVAQEGDMPPLPRPRPDHEAGGQSATPAATATEAISALTDVPQPVTLAATITTDGAPVSEGLVWRIFDTTPDESGELPLAAKSEEAAASLSLPPGEYVVHVAYGRAQTSDTMTVVPGENTKVIALEAGGLRLNAAVEGDIRIPPTLLKFDVMTAGPEGERTLIAQQLSPNDIVTLNAGTYHIVSHFGAINAIVRADLRVEPGQLTDATLYHQASQVSFKLVSEPGGEAIADVEWTVQTPDGTTLFNELGAFPSTVLATGDYIVLAEQGQSVFNREFEVQPGAPREVEVLTQVY